VLCQRLGYRRRQSRLAVINMPDRPDIDVRLAPIKFLFRHKISSSLRTFSLPRPALNLL
jgi:hypothetical protein